LVVLALLGGQSIATAQYDNYDDGDDITPVLWTHVDPVFVASGGLSTPNTYDATAFKYQLVADASSGGLGLGPARTFSYPADNYTNFYVSVDLVDWSVATAQAIGLVARVSDVGPGTTDGYAFGIAAGGVIFSGANYIRILRLENESTKDVFGSGPAGDSVMPIPDLDPLKDYRMVFMGNGTDLEGRLYELPNVTTPIAVVKGNTAGDAIIHTSGVSGMLGFGLATPLGVDMTFDNYYASSRCPMTITDMVVVDNFNDGNDVSAPGGLTWDHYDPIRQGVGGGPPDQVVWTFPAGGYQIVAHDDYGGAVGTPRGASTEPATYTDFRIAADIVNWDDGNGQNGIGLMARLANIGLGATTGYIWTADVSGSGDVDMSSLAGEVPSGLSLSGSDKLKMVPGNSYRFVFSGKGSQLRGSVFQLPETMNPLVDCVATDATYVSGKAGLLAAGNSGGDATFDNYSNTGLTAPAISVTFGAGPGGEFTVTWPANIECVWVLESTSDLSPPAVWTQVATTTTAGAAAKILYDPLTGKNTYTSATPVSTGGNTYYRLKQL